MEKLFLYQFLVFLLKPLFLFLYKPTIINKESIPKKEGAILAGNHRHALDPLLVVACTSRVVHFLSKKELSKGILKYLFKAFGTISVDRNGDTTNAKIKTENILNEGKVIGIFPEGTRNKSDILLPFKKGAVNFAKNTNTPIIPFVIIGKFKLFSKNLTIIFGEPLYIKNIEIDKANEMLRDKIIELKLNSGR